MATIVEGLPADRPLCEHCGKKLAYWSDDLEATRVETAKRHYDGSPVTKRVVLRKRFIRWKGYPTSPGPFFCTLTCALGFATNVIQQRRIGQVIAADRRAAGG